MFFLAAIVAGRASCVQLHTANVISAQKAAFPVTMVLATSVATSVSRQRACASAQQISFGRQLCDHLLEEKVSYLYWVFRGSGFIASFGLYSVLIIV